MYFFILASLLATCLSQQYTCNFVMRDPSMPQGFVNGKMEYDRAAGKWLNTYTTTGNNELNEYDASTKAGKYLYKYSTKCSCTVQKLSTSMPDLTKASGADSGAGVTSVTFSGGFPTKLTLASGRTYTYTGCTTGVVAADIANPANCDCGAPLDIIVVLDRSCSISTPNFNTEKQFVLDFVNGFKYGPALVNLGLANFHLNTWDGPVTLPLGTTEANVLAGANALQCYPQQECLLATGTTSIASGTCCGCGTCISCGLIAGADRLAKQIPVEKGTIRESASKVILLLTDGYHNKVVSPFLISPSNPPKRDARGEPFGEVHTDKNGVVCNEDQTQTLCVDDLSNDLKASVAYANNAVPGVKIFAVGVGQTYSDIQLLTIAQGKQNQVFATRDWSALTGLVAGLIQETCQSVPGTTCDPTCCGFCDCGGNCVAPDGCDASNICLATSITGPCCKSIPIPAPGPLSCQGTDKCYAYGCDQTLNGGQGGCTKTLIPVKANTTCAGYTCDPVTGNTVYTNLCPCKVACTADADCPGKTACNTVQCVKPNATDSCQNKCVITDTSASCQKGDKCYTDSCDPTTGCKHVANPVTPDTKCTTYKCDSATGNIVSTDIGALCQKGDKCYTDSCDPTTGCKHVVNPVTPNTQCTTYACDSTTGKIVSTDTSARCQLGDKCYTDSCDPSTGCKHVVNPVTSNTQCTTYACDPKTGNIVSTDTSSRCQLGDKCYTDSCDPSTGCKHVLNPITPDTKCTTYTCDPASGNIVPKDIGALCTKSDKCYTYACDPTTGCQQTQNPVTPDTQCTTYKCDPTTGNIVSTDTSPRCQMGDKCYTDSCDPTMGCLHVVNPVTPDTKCTTYKCDPLTGKNNPTDISPMCQKGDLCFIDACDPVTGCSHTPKPIPANTACATFSCNAGNIDTQFSPGCIVCTAADASACDDKNACTQDSCIVDPVVSTNNKCSNVPIVPSCTDGKTDMCEKWSCDPVKGCVMTPVSVPASTACSIYKCDSMTGSIDHTIINCTANQTDLCNTWACDDTKGCVATPVFVPSSDACRQNVCNSTTGAVDSTVVDCLANQTDKCFNWKCDPMKGCVSTPVSVPPSDSCQVYTCDPATGTVSQNVTDCTSNQTDKCNTWKCDPMKGCVSTPVTVPPSTACNIWSCDPATGVVSQKVIDCTANQTDKCFNWKCDPTAGCQSTPVTVPSSTSCSIYKCNSTTGQVEHTTISDVTCSANQTNKCNTWKCDPTKGCVSTPVTVPASDKCTQYACDPKTGVVNKTVTPCGVGNTNKCIQWSCNVTVGCVQKNVTVPPSDECNLYVCNKTTGLVDYTNLKCSPPACTIDGDCNDNNACTDDKCFWPDKTQNKTAKCTNTPKLASVCDDKNACTIDSCDPKTGCKHVNLTADFCDDKNACTKDACNPNAANTSNPCTHVPIPCTRKDICHNATCDATRGCLQIPLDCPKSDNCTLSGCNTTKNIGCYIKVAGNCTPPPLAAAAGLAAGAVAGIVVAGVVAAGAMGGSAAYAFTAGAGSGLTAAVANNPIYTPMGEGGTNPLQKD